MIDIAVVALKVTGAFFVLYLFDPVFDQSSAILDVAAVAAIFGSVLTYNRIKASLTAAESAGKAWHEERDAAVAARDRLGAELKLAAEAKVELIARIAALEQRPDLTKLESLVSESTASMLRHETAAAQRTDRLITAIEALPQAINKVDTGDGSP